MSDNNVLHVEAEAHATQSSDRIEQTAGSSEGVKKIKEKHSTTEFVNIERKDDERDTGDDCTSGNVQNDGTLHPRGNTFGIAILGQVTSDELTCTTSEAQKFVALVDTLPINGNMTTEE